MNKKFFGVCLCAATLGFFLPATHPTSATAAEKEWNIPDAAKWFDGTIEGEVLSKDERENTLTLNVKKVVKETKASKAKKADKLKGEKAVLLVLMTFKDGRMKPDEKQIEFIKEVRKGAKLEVSVKSDGMARLRMTDVPKVIKK